MATRQLTQNGLGTIVMYSLSVDVHIPYKDFFNEAQNCGVPLHLLPMPLSPVGAFKRATTGLKETFQKNLDVIYQEALKAKQYPGCDIWDFFNSKKVDTYCIRKDYRNILIIITDGYLFATNHKIKEGSHGYSYILPQTLADTSSYLISTRTPNLTNLEVRILEVNPLDIKHRDKLVSTLEDWLKKMGVKEKNITVSETSLPTDTKTVIKSFLE